MIPLKLQIKNFLSYGTPIQTIDFAPYNLICLSGKNGHGKSALLDAITWAVWGQARKVTGLSKADDGLLRLGQSHMMAIFDFSCNGNQYRIKREYTKSYGKSFVYLDFGMLDKKNELIPLTEKTIRLTQKKIEDTIHIDFESFSNSALLRQSHSNEFSRKSPKDRKEILASILGLHQYELIRKRAAEKIKEAQQQKQTLTAIIEKQKKELERTADIEAKLHCITEQLHTIEQDTMRIKDQYDQCLAQQQVYSQEREKRDLIVHNQKQLYAKKEAKEDELKQLVCAWRTIQKKKTRIKTIQELEQEKKEVTAAIDQQQLQQQKVLTNKEKLLTVKEQVQQYKEKKQKEIDLATKNIRIVYDRSNIEWETSKSIIDACTDQCTQQEKKIAEIKKEKSTIEQKRIEKVDPYTLDQLKQQLEKRKIAYQQFVSLHNWLQAEQKQIHQKELLSQNKNDPSCPLCEQNLSLSRKRFLNKKLLTSKKKIDHKIERLKKIIPTLKSISCKQHEEITRLSNQHDAFISWHKTYQEIVEKLQEGQQSLQALEIRLLEYQKREKELNKKRETLAAELKNAQKRIDCAEDPAYSLLTKTLQSIKSEIEPDSYNATKHLKLRQKKEAIEHLIVQHEQIKEEIALQQQHKIDIKNLCKKLKIINQEINRTNIELATYKETLQQLQHLQKKEHEYLHEIEQLHKRKEHIIHEKGRVVTEQEIVQKYAHELKKYEKDIKGIEDYIRDYQAITHATGKDGIQALLIEESIPEIEQEANILLGKLTNNQSQLFIESLRDLKKGGTKETLDIKISDSAGIRPYELFSGGEAFRIDFALRIAISKLLARRAGTTLQTLIIDEGFGSQDEEGLAHIMDALYKIQDVFTKIIIISHLSSMKDQFPVHFVVKKEPGGSKVHIVHH